MDAPVREVLDHRVTRRELEVLAALAERLTNGQIALRLGVSERTVESHVSALLRKLAVRGRGELAEKASALGAVTTSIPLPRQLELLAARDRCVGRGAELERLGAWWDASGSRTTFVLVSGAAGIGKSRLVAATAVDVHARGGRVMFAACTDGPHHPFEPFVDALQDEVPRLFERGADVRLEVHRAALSRLFPTIATMPGPFTTDVVDPARDHADVLTSLHACLSTIAEERPLLFVVEDLHWSSSGTRDALVHLASVAGSAPLMVLATTRDGPPDEDAEVAALISRLCALPAVETLRLSGLGVAAAAELIKGVGADLDATRAVHDTGGNPLFLREWSREGPGSRPLRELVAHRFGRLDPADLDVVDIAAVIGDQIDAPLVARVLTRTLDQVLDALERIEAAGLVGPGSRYGRFAFTHDVFRSVRYHTLSASRRMRLHAAVAAALHRQDSEGRLAERARHACLAGPLFDPRTAAELARDAGDLAAAATDHGEAIEHYRRGVDALDLAGDDDLHARLEMRIRLGRCLVLVGDTEGIGVLRDAAEVAVGRGEPAAAAAALCAMVRIPGGAMTFGRSDEWFVLLGNRVLAAIRPVDPTWTVRVLATLGMTMRLTGSDERGTEMVEEAVELARRLDDPVALGQALLSFGFCGGPLDTDQRLACSHELLELGARTGHVLFTLAACQQLSWCHRELGDVEEMFRWHDASAPLTDDADLEQLVNEAGIAMLVGDLDRATTTTDTLAARAEGSSVGAFYVSPLRRGIADVHGRLLDEGRLQQLIDVTPVYRSTYEALLARTLARSGRVGRARPMLDHAHRSGFEPRYAANGSTMAGSCWAEVAFLCDDPIAAAAIAEWFEPLQGRFVDNGVVVWDTVDRVRALALLAVGDPIGAATIADHAVAASRRRRTPILLGRELVVLAAAHGAFGSGDDKTAIDEARSIAERSGANLIIHDIHLFLDRRSARIDDFGLTPREREVLRRVRAGDTNTQIAHALGISPATVRTHLEHSYAKLGVSTRTAAIARVGETSFNARTAPPPTPEPATPPGGPRSLHPDPNRTRR